MSIVDNVLKLYPTKGKQAMKNLVDQIQMRRDDSQPDSNQVMNYCNQKFDIDHI